MVSKNWLSMWIACSLLALGAFAENGIMLESIITTNGTVKLTLREQAGAAGVASPFESRGARDGVPSEERATP